MTRGPFKLLAAGWRFVVEVAVRWYRGGVGDLAAGVTFWILVSLPAAVLALLAALGWLGRIIGANLTADLQENVTGFVDRVFTAQGSSVRSAVDSLFRQTNPGLLTVSLGVALWSVSRGFAGLIRALEDIYEVEDGRAWYHTRFVALLLGLGSLLISAPLILLEQRVWSEIDDGVVEEVARTVVAVAVLIGWASTIYHFAPAQRSRFRDDLPGAVAAAVMWWLLTIGVGWYVTLTADANGVTAAIGASLLALTWLWMSVQVLLIGGVVNFVYGQRRRIPRRRHRWHLTDRLTGEIRKITANGDAAQPEPGA
ncbi:MAG: YihY/virulence factor BrkB family protein [Acidimicrobiia bacterium]|nr:YihY/virulence factor BrkB family protein [Acidimicrobiia bacterium]